MTKVNLEVFRGDTKTYNLTFKDASDNRINITGWTLWFTVKSSETALDASAIFQKEVTSHSDAVNGVTAFTLTSTNTTQTVGDYFYDMQFKKSTGEIVTFMYGKFKIMQDITLDNA